MSYLLQRKVMSFVNSSTTITVGTWVAHRKVLKTESNSIFQNGSDLKLMQQEHNSQDRIKTQLQSQVAIPELDSICWKIREDAKNYENFKFSILTIAGSQFQLRLLEVTYLKIRQPSLRKQKEFVFSLQLFKRLQNADLRKAARHARFCHCSRNTIKTTQVVLQVIVQCLLCL